MHVLMLLLKPQKQNGLIADMKDLKPGTLMRVPISVSWHSGYYIEEDGSLGEDMRLTKDDVVMYLETKINTYQPGIKRYKCLFGDRFILMNERALVPVSY